MTHEGKAAPVPAANHITLALLCALALYLVWQVGRHTLVAYLAPTSPGLALQLNGSDARTLVIRAEQLLFGVDSEAYAISRGRDTKAANDDRNTGNGGSSMPTATWFDGPDSIPSNAGGVQRPEDRKAARHLLEKSLQARPLNARALRLLGTIARLDGEPPARVQSYMQAATAISMRESIAAYWQLKYAVERGDFDAALAFGDILLRSRRKAVDLVGTEFARLAENPTASERLKERLVSNPPWRTPLLVSLADKVRDVRVPFDLFYSLRQKSSEPPTPKELAPYFNLLFKNQLYEFAYYVWLELLPERQFATAGLITNPDFEFGSTGLPFDWSMRGGRGIGYEILPISDGTDQHALAVTLGPGQVELRHLTQVLMLQPGTYILKAAMRGDISGRRGLVWRARCMTSRKVIGETTMFIGYAAKWKESEARLTVPESDCKPQLLQLELDARSPSEQLATGKVWVDKVSLEQASN